MVTFDTTRVGKKIASLRKAQNITQMELADKLGISYQAVSNWERGNSMPDISKLGELSAILEVCIDELIGDGKPTELIRHIIDGDERDYIIDQKIEADTVAAAAPVLKPSQTTNILEEVVNNNPDSFNVRDLVQLAPFLDEDYLETLVDRITEVDRLSDVSGLLPFLDESAIDKLASKAAEVDVHQLTSFAPFMSEDGMDKLVEKIGSANIRDLTPLAPFMSESSFERICDRIEVGSIKDVVPLAPFMSDRALDKLVARVIERGDIDASALSSLAPFLDDSTLKKIADTAVRSGNLALLKAIAAFM